MFDHLPPQNGVTEAALAGEPDGELAWLAACGYAVAAVEPLAGDVSARRYRRVAFEAGGTAVVVRYPPELLAGCRRFIASGALLAAAGVAVPRVLAADCAAGRMLVEDAGGETLDLWATARPWGEVAERLRAALAVARAVAGLDPAPVAELSPPLDRALLTRELALSWEHYLQPAGLVADSAFAGRLRSALDDLVAAVAAVPPVPCHRDFMVRNLVPRDDGGVTVLDHQDLRLGPPLYDLASLLNDTLFPPPRLEVELLAEWGVGAEERADYHRVAAQRTLKALGSYAMAAAAGNRRRLPLVAPTLRRALAHLAAAPETADLAGELVRRATC